MATSNSLLTDWIRDAYGMELGLAQMLEEQARHLQQDSELGQGVNHHLQATRTHADLLRRRLLEMGVNTRTIEPRLLPIGSGQSVSTGSGDPATNIGLVDFVNESFEIASYQALAALATELGDRDTANICAQILQDETAMVQALDRILPHANGSSGTVQGVARAGSQEQQNLHCAQANFDALNAHDVDRWLGLTTEDFEGEAPGTSGPMTRQQNRDYLSKYLTAFPDLHFHVLRTIAQGEFVGVDWYASGTHTGPMYGPDGMTIPATGRKATEYGHNTFQFLDGKIFRTWTYFDLGALMQQLGLMPGA